MKLSKMYLVLMLVISTCTHAMLIWNNGEKRAYVHIPTSEMSRFNQAMSRTNNGEHCHDGNCFYDVSQLELTSNSFDETSKTYITHYISLWNQVAKKARIVTGFADIFNDMQKIPVDTLISDPIALKNANDLLNDTVKNPILEALSGIQKMNTLNIYAASNLQEQMERAVIQAAMLSALRNKCPDVCNPPNCVLDSVGATDFATIEKCYTEYLYCNQTLDSNKALPYYKGFTLLWAYLRSSVI